MTKKYNKTNIAGVAIVLASLGLGLGCGAHKEDMSKPPEPKPIVDPIKPPPKELVVEPIELPELPIKDPISKDEPIVVEPPIKPVVYDDIEVKPQPIITEQSAELTSLEGKLATLPELAKYQSKGMQEAIPLLKTVVDKFVLLKDNSPDVCTNKYGLTQNLKQLRKLCDQELRRVGLLPDDYHSTDVSEHPIFVYSKEETEAVSLTILTQALTKAHEAGDYGLLHQKDTKALPKYLDALLNSYREEEECGLWCQIKKNPVETALVVAAVVVAAAVTIGIIVWCKSNRVLEGTKDKKLTAGRGGAAANDIPVEIRRAIEETFREAQRDFPAKLKLMSRRDELNELVAKTLLKDAELWHECRKMQSTYADVITKQLASGWATTKIVEAYAKVKQYEQILSNLETVFDISLQ